jgi:hypothetical protein
MHVSFHWQAQQIHWQGSDVMCITVLESTTKPAGAFVFSLKVTLPLSPSL